MMARWVVVDAHLTWQQPWTCLVARMLASATARNVD
jgi:hypothetical protein